MCDLFLCIHLYVLMIAIKNPRLVQGLKYIIQRLIYNKSNAIAKKVTLNGRIKEQYPPPTAYTPKNAPIDSKKRIQYFPVDFFAVSIFKSFCKYKTTSVIKLYLIHKFLPFVDSYIVYIVKKY